MKISIRENYEAVSLITALEIAEFVRRRPDAVFCFPAGDTPRSVYKQLIGMSGQGRVDFRGCTFIGLDEWAGLARNDHGSCAEFLYDSFFTPLGIADSRIHLFDGAARDPEAECARMTAVLARWGPIDLTYVGLGLNGHIGLNEPGVDASLAVHVAELDATTRSVGQKYFARQTKLDRGMTLGFKPIMESRRVILGVSGAKKAEIVGKVVHGEITGRVPGSLLRNHSDCLLIADREAAACLEGYDEKQN